MLLAIVGLTVTLIVFAVQSVVAPVQATNDYLSAIQDRRYEDAYQLTCRSTRPTYAQFLAAVRQQERQEGPITDYNVDNSELNENSRAITRGTITRGGTTYDLRVDLRKEDGDWHVCSARRSSGGSGDSTN
jgi:hypothetical protein